MTPPPRRFEPELADFGLTIRSSNYTQQVRQMTASDIFEELCSSRCGRQLSAVILLAVSALFLTACSYEGNLGAVSCSEDQPCPTGADCVAGFCIFEGDAGHLEPDAELECSEDELECHGQCVANDEQNCGICDTSCGVDEVCEDSQCVHDTSCDSPEERYCEVDGEEEGICLNVTADLENCGFCDFACLDPVEADAACEESNCVYTCLDDSLDFCVAATEGDRCKDHQSDNDYCGNCDTSCDDTQFCQGGTCVELACDPGIEDDFGGGEGTVDEPFLICNAAQLNLVGTDISNWGRHFEVSAPINLAEIPEFHMIGTDDVRFTGTFNGNGHAIENLILRPVDSENLDEGDDRMGMFRSVEGEIRNVHLVDADVKGRQIVGILVGALFGVIEDSVVTGKVSGVERVGGLVGATGDDNEIINSTADVDVSGGTIIGGLVGRTGGSVTGSHASGTVTGDTHRIGGLIDQCRDICEVIDSHTTGEVSGNSEVGGLIGRAAGSISGSSHSLGTVQGNSEVGGLVGYLRVTGSGISGSIQDSQSSSHVIGNANTGGLVGTANGPIVGSHTTGEVAGTSNVGGLVGHLRPEQGSINDSFAESAVVGNGGVGGLVGYSQGTIVNSHATGEITANGSQLAGGLVGDNHATISDSYATGNLTTAGNFENAGGLVGFSHSGITDSYATGHLTISGNGDSIGGFVGQSNSSISSSYATGDVTISGSGEDAGGFVGYYSNSTIDESFATGNITAGSVSHVGGFVGNLRDNGRVFDSYALGDVTGDSQVGGFAGWVRGGGQNGEARRCYYSLGAVSGGADTGEFVGQNPHNNVHQSYWNSETGVHGSSNGGTELNNEEFALESSFDESWDFEDIWILEETDQDRPRLRHEFD